MKMIKRLSVYDLVIWKLVIHLIKSRAWWHRPIIPALQRQMNLSKFKARMVYMVSTRTAKTTKEITCLKKTVF